MKTKTYKYLTQLAVAGLFASMFLVAACDSSSAVLEADGTSSVTTPPTVANLTDQLQLTAAQTASLEELMAKQGENNPGTLWYMAAELQSTLTAEQKTDLIAEVQPRTRRQRTTDGVRPQRRFRNGRENAPAFLEDLTDEQQAQIEALRDSNREAMKALVEQRRAGALSEEEMEAAVQNLRESMQTSLSTVLTEDQLAQLEAAREAREARRQEFRDRAGADENRGRRAQGEFREQATRIRGEVEDARREALGLTAEQEAQLEAARTAQREKAEAIFETLRAADGDRESVREQMEALREENEAAMAEILSEDQREIIEIHRALAFNAAKNRTGDASGQRGKQRLNSRRFNRLNR